MHESIATECFRTTGFPAHQTFTHLKITLQIQAYNMRLIISGNICLCAQYGDEIRLQH